MSGMLSSLPPLEDVFNMAGMNLPNIMSVKNKQEKEVTEKNKEARIKIRRRCNWTYDHGPNSFVKITSYAVQK